MSAEIVDFIEDVRGEIIMYTEEGLLKDKAPKDKILLYKKMKLSDVKTLDNYDKPMVILVPNEEDPTKGRGYELKTKLEKYKKDMTELIDPKYRSKMKLPINTEDVKGKNENKKLPWHMNMFLRTVLAADVALLNKTISDIKNSEIEIVSELLNEVGAEDFKFDQVIAKVIPNSNYVMQGEEYKADIISFHL